MAIIDDHSLLMWLAIACLVALVSATGMLINRLIIFRAHRRALQAFQQEEATQRDTVTRTAIRASHTS